jgi:sugar lactone lactonase YvrE
VSLLSAPAAVTAVVQRAHGLLEAPRLAPDGEMVYSDVTGGGVWGCSSAGVVRALLPKRRGIGGIVPHADGGWVISGRTLIHLGADGSQREVLADDGATGFNDLGTTPAGELLAGVLRYRPLAGEAPRAGQLLLLGEGGERRLLSEAILWPNGIGMAPDARTVYVSDYARQLVLVVSTDGGPEREFARAPRGSADGLAVDAEGGVWLALGEGGGVARFDPDGRLDELISLPAKFVSSLSFGGSDQREVLITAVGDLDRPELGGTLLRARSEIPGLALSPVRV